LNWELIATRYKLTKRIKSGTPDAIDVYTAASVFLMNWIGNYSYSYSYNW
jgi:hypothetical protein